MVLVLYFTDSLLQCGSIRRFKMGSGSYCAGWFLNMEEDLLEEFMIQVTG